MTQKKFSASLASGQSERVGKHAQHRDDLLAISPAHLTHELDARDQIHRTARPEEQAVTLYQKARHTYRLGVCYPIGRWDPTSGPAI